MAEFKDKKTGISVSANDSSGAEFLRRFREISDRYDKLSSDWIENLIASGVKAAHPNDGWVERRDDGGKVTFSYPYFNHGPKVGDKIALGYHEEFHIVTVTQITKNMFSEDIVSYHFKEDIRRISSKKSGKKQSLLSKISEFFNH